MAYIQSLTYYLPEEVVTNELLDTQLGGVELVAKTAGVESRRKAADDETASDLAVKAAEKFFSENSVDRD